MLLTVEFMHFISREKRKLSGLIRYLSGSYLAGKTTMTCA